MLKNNEINLEHLECSSSLRVKHYLKEPIYIACGHCMCKECIQSEVASKNNEDAGRVKCSICNEAIKVDLNQVKESTLINLLIGTNVNKLINSLSDRMNKPHLEKFKGRIK